ncbi:trehalose operon repressor [Niallia sp. 01092]|uniref:trehalose operon repressor n=1 Tax=unclassified Niallia TaxID=2837522 RepID=UPI003FD10141
MSSKYVALYSDIVSKIENGSYTTNSKLPSESSLMEQYEISRDTVRKALHALEQNGYIHKIKGKGSFVMDFSKFDFPVTGLVSFKELAEKLHLQTKTIVHTLELIPSDSFLQNQLDLTGNEKVWKVFRAREIGGKKIILDKDYFHHTYIPCLTKEICQYSIYKYIEEEIGLQIGFANKEITVEPCTEEDRSILDLENYHMVVVVKSTVHLQDGSLFQYSESRHRPDKFKFTDFARRIQLN